MQENRKDNEQRGGQEGAGRLNDARQEQGASGNAGGRDISEVDQQEGDMNNGTLGGNFDQDSGTTGSEQRS